jgi:hypothetical protein
MVEDNEIIRNLGLTPEIIEEIEGLIHRRMEQLKEIYE